MITIICCIGNRSIFEKCLGESLRNQTAPYKFIEAPMELSMPASYNSVLNKITTKYVAFIHQDVRFLEETWIERAEQMCDRIEDLGVVGCAGKSWGGKCTGFIIHHYRMHTGHFFNYYGKDYETLPYGNQKIKGPELSQTLDDLVLIIPMEVFKKVQFDEEVLQEVGVDYCLEVKHKLNLNSYALPLRTWHNPLSSHRYKIVLRKGIMGYKSPFHAGDRIHETQKQIKEKWKGIFNLIFATVDIDICPKCKKKPCHCKNPLTMEECVNYDK